MSKFGVWIHLDENIHLVTTRWLIFLRSLYANIPSPYGHIFHFLGQKYGVAWVFTNPPIPLSLGITKIKIMSIDTWIPSNCCMLGVLLCIHHWYWPAYDRCPYGWITIPSTGKIYWKIKISCYLDTLSYLYRHWPPWVPHRKQLVYLTQVI